MLFRSVNDTKSEGNEEEDKKIDKSEEKLTAEIVERKYKLKDKYWWDSDSNLQDYEDDINKKINEYSGAEEKQKDSLKSETFIGEKYKGYYRLSVLLRDKLKPQNDSVKTEFKRYKGIMRNLFSKTTDTDDKINAIVEKFEIQKKMLELAYQKLKDSIKEFEDERKKLDSNLNKIQDEANSNKQALAAIPSISSALGTVTPSITLVGQSNFNSKNWFGEVRLFTGSTQLKNQTENLFIPEASKWGIIINFTKGFDDKNKTWSANMSVGYLGKNLYKITPNEKDKTKNDSTVFSVSAFHFKGGFQKIVEIGRASCRERV